MTKIKPEEVITRYYHYNYGQSYIEYEYMIGKRLIVWDFKEFDSAEEAEEYFMEGLEYEN